MTAFRSIGLLYLLSGLWCALKPHLASEFLGFQFEHEAAKAEFIAVYGGLQFGLALGFLLASLKPIYQLGACYFALIFSSGLFSFRLFSIITVAQSPALMLMLCIEVLIVIILFKVWLNLKNEGAN